MKTSRLIQLAIMAAFLTSCRVADFTMLSTKNVGDTGEMVLLQQGVKGKAIHLEDAVDKCLEKAEGGVYLQNVVLYERMFRWGVKGDVWGYPIKTE